MSAVRWFAYLLALALAVPLGVSAAGPASVTIAAQPPDLLRDRRLTLYGAISAARPKQIVSLEARDCGQSLWRLVANVETDVAGRWTWPYFYPGITASIRARWNGAVSAPVLVRDRVFVELRRRGGRDYAVSVRAKRSFEGRRVLFQRLDPARGWVTVKTVVLTKSGAPPGVSYVYSSTRFRATAPAGALVRAHMPLGEARPCYLGGRSNFLRLR
jgi:hypothetical protein